jgi:alkaline phosphatase
MATGCKTANGFISVDPGGRLLPTILELAGTLGKSSGVITTDTVTSATPAVFYAHVDSRGRQEDIALQLVESRVNVAMGSGRRHFDIGPDGRKDGQDVLARARGNGFDVRFDLPSLAASRGRRLLGLFTFDESGPSLEAMLEKTISTLSANRRGFFVMAESSLPDKGGHKNDIDLSLLGMNELENALRCALRYAERDRHTLVVVTSDHDTGGLAVQNGNEKNPRFTPVWIDGRHTGNMVAVYAFGPGAEKFTGTLDNTDIPKIFASVWGRTLGAGDAASPEPAR